MRTLIVTVVGDAIVDFIVPIHGISIGNTYHRNIVMACGGTANTAVWTSRHGIKTNFVGKLGSDPNGTLFREDLKQEKITDLTVVDDKHPTGVCISLVEETGERTMLVNRGANDHLNKNDINERMDEIIKSKIVYFTGYFLMSKTSKNAIKYLLKECNSNNCEIWFNPGAPNIINAEYKKILRNRVDLAILNLGEGKALTHQHEKEKILNNLEKISEKVVLTMGPEGCIASINSERTYVPSEKVDKVVDTTGAGDAFAAGFIVGMLKNKGIEKSCEMGHRIAADVIKKIGAR